MFLHSLALNREEKHLIFFFKSIEAFMLNSHDFMRFYFQEKDGNANYVIKIDFLMLFFAK